MKNHWFNKQNYIQRQLGISYVEQGEYTIVKTEDFKRIADEMERLRKIASEDTFKTHYLGQWINDEKDIKKGLEDIK